jgi:hypothetical protein
VLPMVGDGSQERWWLDGSGGGSDGGCPCVASCVAVALVRLALRAQSDRQRVERLGSTIQLDRIEEVVARFDVPIRPGQRWWAVSMEALSPYLWCSCDSSGGKMKVKLLARWHYDTTDGEANADPWRVQRREWRGTHALQGSESEEWSAAVDVARPPHV